MSDGSKAFLQRWFVTTLGVLVATGLVDDLQANGVVPLLTASLILGVLNAFLRPILMIAALPLLVVTLGLFTIVINALLLYVVGALMKGSGFYVADFWTAIKGAILISIVSFFANLMFGKKRTQPAKTPSPRKPVSPPADTGSGPVIDV